MDPGKPALDAIRAAFGPSVLTTSGSLDRAALRRLIFADPAKRKILDGLLHPLIRARTLERLALVTRPYAIVAVPLLVETDFGSLVDRIAVVDCPDAMQLERLMRRDGVPRIEAAAAIAAQTDRATRLRAAHDVIDNSGDLEVTRRQVAQLHQRYVELAGRKTSGRPQTRMKFAERRSVAQNSEMNSAAELPALAPEHGLITFEQPLTERMRTFLRIEFLYEQTVFHADEPTDFGARAAVTGLLEIVTILGRGDVRTDVIKELERHAGLLGRYRSQPGVDPSRLTGLIDNIEALRTQLADAGPQLINPLKECEFLSTIRHRSAIPGGTCMFDLPDYGFWLHLPGAERRRQLEVWIQKLKPLCDAVAEVLWLTREATEAGGERRGRRASISTASTAASR